MSPLSNTISGIVMTSPELYNKDRDINNGKFTVWFELGSDGGYNGVPRVMVLLDATSLAIAKRGLPLNRKVSCYGYPIFMMGAGDMFRAKCIGVKKKLQRPVHKRILELRHAV